MIAELKGVILMKKKLISLVTLLVVATILGACSNYKFKATTDYQIEDFETINHRGETVTLESLKVRLI